METNLENAAQDFDLGRWLGRREAFGSMAGRCSAAEVECLKKIRDEKLYRGRAPGWHEFCVTYLGSSRTHVNRLIGHLEEFGPAYFHLSQVARVSPETFRAIAPHVTGEGLRCGGEIIPLLPENGRKVAAAVAELRRQVAPPAPAERPALELLGTRCGQVAQLLESMQDASQQDRCRAAALLAAVLLAAGRIGIDLFPEEKKRRR